MKKNIGILFTDDWLAFSPTVLNLAGLLSVHANVSIFAFRPKRYPELKQPNVFYLEPRSSKWEYRHFRASRLFGQKVVDGYGDFIALRRLNELLRLQSVDLLIAVDFYSLFLAQHSIFPDQVHFLSLELDPSPWRQRVDLGKVRSVVIQSKERYDYLFGTDSNHPRFLVQNTPIYRPIAIPKDRNHRQVLHAGSHLATFGIYPMLNFTAKSDYQLYLKGVLPEEERIEINKLYIDLLHSGKVTIDMEYVHEDDIVTFINRFHIGFCMYDPVYPLMNTFNYLTSPSGKMYKYFAAGVPVVGIDIPGHACVREHGAGVLIKDLSSSSILNAIERIEADYDSYAGNCLAIARELSFDKLAAPYIDYLLDC